MLGEDCVDSVGRVVTPSAFPADAESPCDMPSDVSRYVSNPSCAASLDLYIDMSVETDFSDTASVNLWAAAISDNKDLLETPGLPDATAGPRCQMENEFDEGCCGLDWLRVEDDGDLN